MRYSPRYRDVVRTFRLLGIFLVLVTSLAGRLAYADARSDALRDIKETAESICGSVGINGSSESAKVNGDVSAKLGTLIRRLSDLGFSGSGSINIENYSGYLQSDLLAAVKSTQECKLKVFERLQSKFLPESSDLVPDSRMNDYVTSYPNEFGGKRELNLDNIARLSVIPPYDSRRVGMALDAVPFSTFQLNAEGKPISEMTHSYVKEGSTYFFDPSHNRYDIEVSGRTFIVTLMGIKQKPTSAGAMPAYVYEFGVSRVNRNDQDISTVITNVRLGRIIQQTPPINGGTGLDLGPMELTIPVTYFNKGNRPVSIDSVTLFLSPKSDNGVCQPSNENRYLLVASKEEAGLFRVEPDVIPPSSLLPRDYKFSLFKGGIFLRPHAKGVLCLEIDASDINGGINQLVIPVGNFHAEVGDPILPSKNPSLDLFPDIARNKLFKLLPG